MIRKCILHISVDYPDIFQSNKPPVIQRLVDGLSSYHDNFVISLNRVNNPLEEAIERKENHWAIRYFSPSYGIMQFYFLDRVVAKIMYILTKNKIHPSIMMGYKFAIESYICWRLWQRIRVPYIAGFMGSTDCKVFRVKPYYQKTFLDIAQNAKAVIFPTPWSELFFKEYFYNSANVSKVQCHIIPYISGESIHPIISEPLSSRMFVTICRRLEYWRLKNLPRLIEAIAGMCKSDGNWSLDIIGPGSLAAEKVLTNFIRKHGLNGYIRLLGGKVRAEIDNLLPDYCAMVMPSYPESFGLAYLEALGKGVPIMTARNAGLDGFFPEYFPGVIVEHNKVKDIARGLQTLSEGSDMFRRRIQNIAPELRKFDRKSIISSYIEILES